MNFYNILNIMNYPPEDIIDKKVLSIYIHKEFGLCLGLFGFIIARQKTPKNKTDEFIKSIDKIKNISDLNPLFSSKYKLLMKIPLTFEIFFESPSMILEVFIQMVINAKNNNILIFNLKDNDIKYII